MEKYLLGEMNVKALYTEVSKKLYKGNPMIEALPEYNDERKIADILKPYFNDKPIPDKIYELNYNFSSALRNSYYGRNPYIKMDSNFTSIPGFSIIGNHGSGKTFLFEKILTLYPQIINHEQYKNKSFQFKQITWLKMSITENTSNLVILRMLLNELEKVSGEHSYTKNCRDKNRMLIEIINFIRKYAIGCIVLDDVYHIKSMRKDERKKFVGMFRNLYNSSGVCIIFLSTYDTINKLCEDLNDARLFSGQRGLLYMEQNSMENQKSVVAKEKDI